MKTEQCLRLGWLLYAIISIFLFIYMMPFFFIGFSPKQPEGSIQIAQKCLLDLTDGKNLAPPSKIAVWFALHRFERLLATIFFCVLVIISEFVFSKPHLRERIYQIVMWIALGVFFLNFLGIMCIICVV